MNSNQREQSQRRPARSKSFSTRRVHLFVVHSPLAAEMVVLVSRHLQILPSHVSVLLIRRTSGLRRFFSKRGVATSNLSSVYLGSKKLDSRKAELLIRKLDKKVNSLTLGNDFSLYTFDLVTSLNQVLGTHPRACEISLVEEGTTNFRPLGFQYSDQYTLVREQPLYSESNAHRFFDTGMVGGRAGKYLAFSPWSFREAQPICVLDLSTLRDLASARRRPTLIVGPRYGDQEAKVARLDALDAAVPDLPRPIWVKFHPGSSRAERRRLTQLLAIRYGKISTINKSSFLVEAELAAGNIDLIVGWGSSSLSYGELLGVGTYDLGK